MPVRLLLPSSLAPLAGGTRRLSLPGATVGEVVAAAVARHPALAPRLLAPGGGPPAYVAFFLGEEDVRHREGFGTPVPDGAELVVVPAVAGGSR